MNEPATANRQGKTWRVGIDLGGTFTDVVVIDELTGVIEMQFKVLSTPENPMTAFIHAIESLGTRFDLASVSVFHGTTVGTNTLIEKKGAKTSLITTRGFADVLELRRQARPQLYSFDQTLAPLLVPPQRRLEAKERIAFDGTIIEPLLPSSIDLLAHALSELDVESIAICLIHCYANPGHEEMLERALRRSMPGLFVTSSNEVCAEFGEFERTSTVVVNAYIGPRVAEYVGATQKWLAERRVRRFSLVKSNGGLTGAKNATRFPVHLIESGPAAAIIGSLEVGRAADQGNLIAFDVGGTTAKAGLIIGGEARVVTEFNADATADGRYVGGYPIKSAALDVVEIGAGGGSIAWLDEAGVLKAGPQSAGSDPGPACYGRSGRLPTLTDAHVVVGTIGTHDLQRSAIAIHRELALRAIQRVIAEPLGWRVERAAHAIIDVAVANMAEMVRLVTVRRGLEPRDFALVASGGAGPLHAAAVALEVGIRELIVPLAAGVLSALGAAVCGLRHDVSQTVLRSLRDLDHEFLTKVSGTARSKRDRILADEDIDPLRCRMRRFADLRFSGQLFEVTVDLANKSDTVPEPDEIERRFRARYYNEYGIELPDVPVELVNIRITAEAIPQMLRQRVFGGRARISRGVFNRTRQALVRSNGTTMEAQRLTVEASILGEEISGPALIECWGSTAWVPENQKAHILDNGDVRILLN